MVELFVFDDHIRGNEADSADLFATWQPHGGAAGQVLKRGETTGRFGFCSVEKAA